MSVYIVGIGPGAKDHILPIAERAIAECDCLIGADRHISLFHHFGKEEISIQGHFEDAIPYIARNKGKKKIAVLVSGDPGLYSLLGMLSTVMKPEEYTVIPGISTVQLAFAKIGDTWSDARIISLHGRKAGRLADEIRRSAKVFLLTDENFPPAEIAKRLRDNGIENRRAIVFENLSYPDEKIIDTDLSRLRKIKTGPLCVMIIMGKARKAGKKKLYGLGIGPGDPGLITLKAKAVLDSVDTIFVPKSEDDGKSSAKSIISSVTGAKKNYMELTFPMTTDRKKLARYWERAAKTIAGTLRKENEAAFVTIGDPFIYSTYNYLLKVIRRDFSDIEVETVPGVSAFNACASAAGINLVEGSQALAVVPVTRDLTTVKRALSLFDTVVLMKVGSKLDRVIALLSERGLLRYSTLVSRVGHNDEKIVRSLTSLRDKRAGYMSIIIVKRPWK